MFLYSIIFYLKDIGVLLQCCLCKNCDLSGLENLVKPALRAEIGRKKEMLIVSEQTERKKRKQKESANAIERGNGPGVVKRNEAVTTAVAVLGTENGNAIAEGRIVIMTAEVAEGKLCAMLIIQIANVW